MDNTATATTTATVPMGSMGGAANIGTATRMHDVIVGSEGHIG